MKLRTTKTIFILLITSFAWGQNEIRGAIKIETDKIVSDTVNNSPHKKFERRIKIKPIDKSDSELEIRFYKLTALSNTLSLKIIKFKNNKWHAYEYDEWNSPVKIRKYNLRGMTGLEQFISMLMVEKLTSLPYQSELSDKMKKFAEVGGRQMESKIAVMDGHSYTVEFKIGDCFRVYEFDNPDIYAKFYDNVDELKNYVAIKNLFENELIRE